MRPNTGRAILGGFLGTLAITAMMYWVAPLMMGAPMDVAAMLGNTLGVGWSMGMLIHFVNGTLIFPLAFVYLLWDVLPGRATAKGTELGVVLWLLAQGIVMPMMGGGFFSSNAGGMMAVMGSLVGHLIYGVVLGAVSQPPPAGIERQDLRRAA